MSQSSKTNHYLVIILQTCKSVEPQDEDEQYAEHSSGFDKKAEFLKKFYQRCIHVASLSPDGTAFTTFIQRPALCVCPWQNGNDPNWLQAVPEEEIGDLLRDAESERFDVNHIAQQLHSLCDSIENKAAIIDVLWLGQDNDSLLISDHLPLYGALKRMVVWHGADITFACSGPCTDQWKAWCQVLQGSYMSLDTSQQESSRHLFWRGAFKLTGTQIMNPTYLCGFELSIQQAKKSCVSWTPALSEHCQQELISPEPRLFSRELELLQVVQRHTVPSFYLTGARAKLSISSTTGAKKDSQALLNILHYDQVGMVVRLKQGTRLQAVEKLTTLAWEEAVDADAAVMTRPVMGYQVGGKVSLHHFLICADEPGTYTAYLLYPPSCLNGQIAHTLAMHSYEGRSGQIDPAVKSSILEDIPYFEAEDLFHKFDGLSRLQVEVLQEFKKWKEEKTGSSEVSVSEIKSILTLVNSEFLSELKKSGKFIDHEVFQLNTNIQPEYLLEAAECVELESLRIKETLMKVAESARRKRLSKDRSSDSFSVLSPPPVEPVGDSHMDVMAFLKHFNPDGTAVNKKLAPIQRQQTKGSPLLKKFDSGDSIAVPWPDSYRYHYHDMYYNTGAKAEKLQVLCHKLNWHIASLETSTSCGSRFGRKNTQPRRLSLPKDMSCVTADAAETSSLASKKSRPSLEGSSGSRHGKGTSKKSPPSTKKMHPAESDKLPKRNTRGAVSALQKKKESLARAANQSKKKEPESAKKRKQQENHPKDGADDAKSTSSRSRRSERHRKMLEDVVKVVLKEAKITKYDKVFKPAANRLFTITKSFAKDLKSSRNLREEMTNIAKSHVQQVIDFEKARLGS